MQDDDDDELETPDVDQPDHEPDDPDELPADEDDQPDDQTTYQPAEGAG